jgi:hypothetical protein
MGDEFPVVLLPTAYFPPVSYFFFLLNAEKVFIEAEETYHKQTYRNRCEISSSDGKLPLVVPVRRPGGTHTTTRNIGISYRQKWQRDHLRSLQTAYGSSPFFIYYQDDIMPLFGITTTSLLDLNSVILERLAEILGIELSVNFTINFEKEPGRMIDLRTSLSPKKFEPFRHIPRYPQVFEPKAGFIPDLSILDLLFNLGPSAAEYISELDLQIKP